MTRGFNRYGAIASCVIASLLLHLLAPSARAIAQPDDGSEPLSSCYNSLYLPSILVARTLTAPLAPESSADAPVSAAGLSVADEDQQIDGESVNPLPGCNLYPIAINKGTLTNVPVGGTVTDILNGAGGLHIGWLTWNGDNTEAALLANLAPPGNSSTYINPYFANDRLLSVGDCSYGLPGVFSSTEVRNALNLLKTVDITAPVWDQHQVSGGRTHYRIVDFALMRITSYPSSTITSISAQFLGYNANCLAATPTATPTATPMPTGAATNTPTPGPTLTNTATPTPTLPGQGGLLDGIAVLGDSYFDEYRGTDNRGGAYAATTFNLIEILQHRRAFNLGPWGARAEPRRTGYEYVWARSGATSFSMISQGQHTGAAAQIAAGDVSFVFIGVGANDFSPLHGSTYRDIYSGVSTDAQVASKVAGAVRNVTLAVDTVLAAGARGVAVTLFTQWNLDPQLATNYPDAAGRKRVADAIDQVNDGIQTMAAARGVLVVDQNAIGQQLLPQLDSQGNLLVGGQKISFLLNGDAPNYARLSDGQHLGTVVSGLMANAYFIDPLNATFGTGIARLTEVEILAEAGLAAQATPTPTSLQR